MKTSSKWFLRYGKTQNPSTSLFCFPHAGGNSSFFHIWKESLASHIELCLVQLPGRGSRAPEKPISDGSIMIDRLAYHLTLEIDRPFAFFGHSFGALIAFRLVQRLQRMGKTLPEHLFVSARQAPHLVSKTPHMFHYPDHVLVGILRSQDAIPMEILQDPVLCTRFLAVFRADLGIDHAYRYQQSPPLPCPITVFCGLLDKSLGQGDLMAWKDYTNRSFSFHVMAGDHHFPYCYPDRLTKIIARNLKAFR
ncbi:MAG: alpha/beta fold hydrolase [Acidobacteriota bacterium]|nr:alpha/beta fold hydrolase [Acidobacteriota bacterium]